MTNLKINLNGNFDNSYEIKFTEKTWETLVNFLNENWNKRVFLIFDKKVSNLYKKKVKEEIKWSWIIFKSLEINAWEKNKEMKTVLKICRNAQKYSFNRNDIFVAIWWWVIGDIVGFASSIYMRGIDFVQIPTTFVSVFDSSVGGKTWVNLSSLKNLIWTFHQPKTVIINKNYLKTLSKKEVLSGYFEWLKHSILIWEKYFEEFIEDFKIENWEINIEKLENKSLEKNIKIKANIVEKDEKEWWVRKFLNYWHTFGHWIELNSTLAHWICVWFWMIYVNLLSIKLWFWDKKSIEKINNHILEILKYVKLPKITFSKIYKKMLWDKKNESSRINFVILKTFWELSTQEVWNKEILEEVYGEFLKFWGNKKLILQNIVL